MTNREQCIVEGATKSRPVLLSMNNNENFPIDPSHGTNLILMLKLLKNATSAEKSNLK